MDIVNGPISDSENEDSPAHDLQFHSDGSTVSECNEVKIETSNEQVKEIRTCLVYEVFVHRPTD